jgi:uncharacterized membrane protein YgaE (UPF0421/DUF939 family)
MFDAFVGSVLGISAVLALLTLKDKVESYREHKRNEFEKRVQEAARARTKPTTAW